MAIEKAKAKAKTLAGQLGMSLGRMTGFSEDGVYPPMPMMMKANYDMGVAGGAVTESAVLPAGEQEIVANVTISYELR
jgi:uncharacterized protein YggE